MDSLDSLILTTDDVLTAIERLDGVKLAKRTLAQWAVEGVVEPSIAWRRVRRAPRLYSYGDLGRARLVVRLTRQLGMTLEVAREVLAALDAGDAPLSDLLRPVNARQARTMEAVFIVGGGRWRTAMVSVGDTEYVLAGGDNQGQQRFQFGSADEFRIPLADVVKGYEQVRRAKSAA